MITDVKQRPVSITGNPANYVSGNHPNAEIPDLDRIVVELCNCLDKLRRQNDGLHNCAVKLRHDLGFSSDRKVLPESGDSTIQKLWWIQSEIAYENERYEVLVSQMFNTIGT